MVKNDGMNWGFYCRTCGTSSPGWYDEFTNLLRSFREFVERQTEAAAGGSTRAGDTEVGARTFLARHRGHEIWAETETGVLRLSRKTESPAANAALPHRFVSANRSRP